MVCLAMSKKTCDVISAEGDTAAVPSLLNESSSLLLLLLNRVMAP